MNKFRKFLEGEFLKMDEAGDGTGGSGGGSGDGGGSGGDGGTGGGDGQGGDGGGAGDGEGDGNGDGDDGDGDDDLDGLDDKSKAYIKKLRKENAKYRTGKKASDEAATKAQEDLAKVKKALGLEDDETPIEDKLKASEAANAQKEFNLAVRDAAIEFSIAGKEAFEYFEFLVTKKADSLDEDGEITDDEMKEMAEKAKKFMGSGGDDAGSQGGKSSSTGGQGGNGKKPSNGGDTMGAKEFSQLTFSEKGALFGKNPDLYKKLMGEAVAQNLI